MNEETTWLKRALAFPNHMQVIQLHLFPFLSHSIKAIRHISLKQDSVRQLIPILTTPLIGAEEAT